MELIVLGVLFLVGLCADIVGRLTPMPRVSFLLLCGLLVGPAGAGFISAGLAGDWFPVITQVALTMIGFLLGQQLTRRALRSGGRQVVVLSLAKAAGAAAVVFLGLWLVGVGFELAMLLAGIATATASTATFDVVHEAGERSAFGDLLLSTVALDDVWGLIFFALLLAFASHGGGGLEVLSTGIGEVVGSMALGVTLGLPMAYLTGRLSFGEREGEPILAESLGFIFLAAGAAVLLELSSVLTAVCMGSVVASFASHHQKPFNAIEGVEWPFMILFFVMAGASLVPADVTDVLAVLLVYLLSRALGTWLGTVAGGRLVGVPPRRAGWLGLGLLPQAEVALGMALIASQRFPELAQTILAVTIAATVILEIGSPMVTRLALRRNRGPS